MLKVPAILPAVLHVTIMVKVDQIAIKMMRMEMGTTTINSKLGPLVNSDSGGRRKPQALESVCSWRVAFGARKDSSCSSNILIKNHLRDIAINRKWSMTKKIPGTLLVSCVVRTWDSFLTGRIFSGVLCCYTIGEVLVAVMIQLNRHIKFMLCNSPITKGMK